MKFCCSSTTVSINCHILVVLVQPHNWPSQNHLSWQSPGDASNTKVKENLEDCFGVGLTESQHSLSVERPGTTAAVLWRRQVSECPAASKGRQCHGWNQQAAGQATARRGTPDFSPGVCHGCLSWDMSLNITPGEWQPPNIASGAFEPNHFLHLAGLCCSMNTLTTSLRTSATLVQQINPAQPPLKVLTEIPTFLTGRGWLAASSSSRKVAFHNSS